MEQRVKPPAAAERTALRFLLPDGRQMGYSEYGKPDGFPIFLLHGTPGSRLWFADDDPVAHALNVRFIATDRPGYGLSDPKCGRKILDYPKDIEALADFMGIDSFSVIGISGGSAYAAACAWEMPERVVSAAMVAGMSPFKNGKPPKGMCPENRGAFFLSRYFPWGIRYLLNSSRKLMHTKPQKYIQSVQSQVGHLCASDRKIMKQEGSGPHVLMHLSEAFRQNVREAVSESALLARPWGFEYNKITVPLQVWHGTEDTLAPIGPVREAFSCLPGCQLHFLEGRGHFLDGESEVWCRIVTSVLAGKDKN